ncbi:MAG: hypothetical protein Tsb0021_16710 [Chlamydiales bacterium]
MKIIEKNLTFPTRDQESGDISSSVKEMLDSKIETVLKETFLKNNGYDSDIPDTTEDRGVSISAHQFTIEVIPRVSQERVGGRFIENVENVSIRIKNSK